jgi:hypothetical protein
MALRSSFFLPVDSGVRESLRLPPPTLSPFLLRSRLDAPIPVRLFHHPVGGRSAVKEQAARWSDTFGRWFLHDDRELWRASEAVLKTDTRIQPTK